MTLLITINPVGNIFDTVKLLHQVADQLPEQVRRLQLFSTIISTTDHAEVLGWVEFIPDKVEVSDESPTPQR